MELQNPGRRMNSEYENNNMKAGVILVKLQYIVQYSDIWLWYSNIIWSAVKKGAENIRQPLDPTCSHQRNTPLLYVGHCNFVFPFEIAAPNACTPTHFRFSLLIAHCKSDHLLAFTGSLYSKDSLSC